MTMWTSDIFAAALFQSPSWAVESFSGEQLSMAFESDFPLEPLSVLVSQRRKTLRPQETPTALFTYVGLEDIEPETGLLLHTNVVEGRKIRSASKCFSADDVLYSRLRPYLNKVFVASGAVTSGLCSNEFYVLTPNRDKVLPIYLRFLLSMPYVVAQAQRWQTGSALPRVPLESLGKVQLPIPPIDVQRQIVEQIDQYALRLQVLESGLNQLRLQARTVIMDLIEKSRPPDPH